MSTEQVAGWVRELRDITAELRLINARAKEFRQRKVQLEALIMDYLKKNNQPGIKCNETIILLDEKNATARKKAKEKEQSAVDVLRKNGITPQQAHHIYEEWLKNMKGASSKIPTLKYKSITQ